MKRLKVAALFSLVFIALSVLILVSCSDKTSTEACLHRTSLDLDKGNYDAVLASSCANVMQIGAAWFGKAGYDITNILNRFVDADSNNSTTGGTGGSTKTDLDIYMTSLTGEVTADTLNYLDNAKAAYGNVSEAADGSDAYKDARFYMSLVDSVKSLSLIKTVIGTNIVGSDGSLNKACDANSNGVPDSADAMACELLATLNINNGLASSACGTIAGMSYAPSTLPIVPVTLSTVVTGKTLTGTFSGLTVMSSGTGTTSGCSPAGNTTYKQVLYRDGNNKWWAATTTSELCSDGTNTWPCPVTGANMDLVASINTSLTDAVDSLATSITGTNSADVQQSIKDIQAQACTDCSTVCPGVSCPSACVSPYTGQYACTAESIANYLQTNLK